ncbi:GNAT family N-acetyltransferase [Duganella sp. BJB488]|uniref:GNAT family N-acetyltransferase n=1 Tax=unclassified Duganella TaxID=2636909 RepID=UPI000E345BCB|nr:MULTISPECIES: GNAT family N-acetyltransferase [unclassified Duganella]NVD72825.1 GNAT family N-acetyltransferase [Duganella sp. BJB1802]RFP11663.1 GNAT family N-acetyltransferase [Duganella sp. BJB489]RFP15623.1 GNAT family N-acetyltransferase [Duganella sp. BJB488]RFP30571.1 GNAT family N-acetyltransferase [Duganella sp. BJB480]
MHTDIQLQTEDPTARDSLLLMEELSTALEAITGDSGNASFDIEDVCGPAGCFVVARDGAGVALGCGALRPLEPGVAEIKRMYARHGTSGVGSAVLRFLEEQAQALGYQALWLETRLVNRRAVDFYEARGYQRIANYGKYIGNPLAVCFEKQLPSV